MNWFTRPQQQRPQQQQGQQGNPQQQTQQPVGPQGQQGQGPQQSQQPADPFAGFQGMFGSPAQAAAQAPVQQQQQQQMQQQAPAGPQYAGYLGQWNEGAVRQGLSKADFAGRVDPALMQRLTSGDMSALPEVLNGVAREVTYMTLNTSHGFVDRGVQAGLDKFGGGLDDRFRDYQIRSENNEHEVLSNPAVAPVYQGIKQMIANSDRSLHPEAVTKKAMEWFNTLSSQMTTKQQTEQGAQQQQGAGETDWFAALGGAPAQAQGAPAQQSSQSGAMPQGGAPAPGAGSGGF
jgi:hypothetical protein